MRKSQFYRKPYRIKKKKSILKNRFFWFGILTAVFFSGIFYFIYLSPVFQMKEIKISGNQKVPTGDLKNAVAEQVKKKIVFFESQSIFLADFKKLGNIILQNYPQIEKVNLNRDFPGALVVKIGERKPIAVFCQLVESSTEADQNEKCFLMDKSGIIFEEVYAEITGMMKTKNQILSLGVELGKMAVAEAALPQILSIKSDMEENLKIPLREAILVSEQRVNVKTLEGWEIYFNLKGDLNWQITELKTILENKIPPEKRKNLDYIDLRFDRVFVSPKGIIGG